MSMSFTHTVLITGGTSGLGYHCALSIAREHPEYLVVIASRTDPKSAATSINHTLHQKNTVYLPLDLSNLAKVRSFTQDWETKKYPPICMLVLNAGLQFPEGLHKTHDGFEATFAINHIGHSLLFHLLVPYFADKVRVVLTASGTHDPAQNSGFPDAKYDSAEELAHPTGEMATMKDGRQRYATSKLVNIMWTYALHRRLAFPSGKGITVNAFDPGLMPGTGLAREYSPILRWIWYKVMPRIIPLMRLVMFANIHTADESGASLAWLAMSAEVEGVSGSYYEGRKKIKSSVSSYDEKKQEDLWNWTIKNTATGAEEIAKFKGIN